ncbi:hypothetical protein QA644_06645 [Rhizobium sp. CC1099]|uniref:hypothetical protein n=1 Tax=Rhizobium sp. CC1099 TaxID=3039160 RepID=UPI0024B1F86E|nr:hypothetical protein [Rhizobium sp. CC1099]WFU88737.1 hypothetical protein QA644_06645 [Rhizobium sp. CC1099]
MRAVIAFLLVALALSGCNTAPPEPIRGSLTYGRVVHVPARAGYTVKHEFPDKFGYRVYERYVVQPDGTLKLISRRTGSDYWHFPRMKW